MKLKKVEGTTSLVPTLILYNTRNKKNPIILSQDARYARPYLRMNIGINYTGIEVELDDYEFSTIEAGLKELAEKTSEKMEQYNKKIRTF